MILAFPKPKRRIKRRYRVNKLGHEFLYGIAAHFLRRVELYRRAGGKIVIFGEVTASKQNYGVRGPAKCELCSKPVWWDQGHWIHLEVRHCDCMGCSKFGCKECHKKLHHEGREFL